MNTPRGSYGGGYGGYYPSSSSFPDTPIYDSLVAERGTPQIAPIRVPSPQPGYDNGFSSGYGSSGNLPALPALPALPSGPSAPSYQAPQPAPAAGYPGGGYPQPPAPYIPQQAMPPRGGFAGGGGMQNGFQNGHAGGGFQGMPQQHPAPGGYEAARPLPPRPMPPRQVPGGHPEDQYPRRNLGNGGGGYYQG